MKSIKTAIAAIATLASTIAFGGLYIVSGGDFRSPSLTYWFYAGSTEHPTNILQIAAQNGCTAHTTIEIDDGTVLTDVLSGSGHRDFTNMTYQFQTEGIHKIKVYANGQNPKFSILLGNHPNYRKIIVGGDLSNAIGVDNGQSWLGDGVEEYIIKNGVKIIGTGHFRNAANLEYVYLPDSIISIGSDAFNMNGAQMTTKLKTVRLPRNEQLDTLPKNLFFRTKALETLTIPSTIKNYEKWVFFSCQNLTTLTLGQANSVLSDSFCQTNGTGGVTQGSITGITTVNFYGTLDQWKSGPLPEHFGNTEMSGDLDTVTITGGKAVPGSVTLNLNYPEPED